MNAYVLEEVAFYAWWCICFIKVIIIMCAFFGWS